MLVKRSKPSNQEEPRTMGKENLIFKLDSLEYQLHYINQETDKFQPRFKQTLQFFNSKSKKVNKKVNKLVENSDRDAILEEIKSIRLRILDQKIHHVLQRLHTHWIKNAIITKDPEVSKIGIETFIKYVSYSKLIKLTVSLLGGIKGCPDWFHEHEFYRIANDKTNELNPSLIYNDVFVKRKLNPLVSKLMNNKIVKEQLLTYENALHVLLNEKDKVKKTEDPASNNKQKSTNDNSSSKETKQSKSGKEESASESEAESESESEPEEDLTDGREAPELDSETEELLAKEYDGLLVGSDEESDDEVHLDPNVDYNQVTDEEPDYEDSNSEEEEDSDSEPSGPKAKKPKYELPELMHGYISGEEDEDIDDKVAKRQSSNVPAKKNRRGQRARQKIWEKKYGSQAKHVQRQLEKERQEREKRQREYEERQAKREAKAAQNPQYQRIITPQHSSGSVDNQTKNNIVEKPIHPSWEAKKIAEEKQKNVKFQGKKITFD